MKSKVAIATLVLLTAAGPACLNDRDSVKALAARMPEKVDILVGRFERNPPPYYQMRIDRETKELAQNPNKLDNYDDIAVAYDRIGNDLKAKEWIEKKLVILNKLGDKAPKMARYSYYANHGTFLAHLWFKTHDFKNLKVLDQAGDEIEKALEINPAAHAGREGMQLKIIDYYASSPKEFTVDELRYFGGHGYDAQEKYETGDNEAAVLDLIRLGGGAESPDMHLLAAQYDFQQIDAIAYLRARELNAQGHKGLLHPREHAPAHMDSYYEQDYKTLRDNADEWQRNRTAFMIQRLQTGRHPDTDPHFWDGYVETPRAVIPERFGQNVQHFWNRNDILIVFIGGFFGLIGFALWVNSYMKRHPGRPMPPPVIYSQPKGIIVPQEKLNDRGGDIAKF